MSRTNRADAPLFQVDHHHSGASGTPPHIADPSPSQYLGYFENNYGEQAIFVDDRNSRRAVLYLGDAGWQNPHAVVEVACPSRSSQLRDRAGVAARLLAGGDCYR